MTGYTKLFGSIVGSTIWNEDDQTRIVWITMLAMANQHGEVEASIPGLAKFAKVPLDATERALEKLKSPDKYSRSKEFNGRRIEEIEGGWFLLNYEKYRKKASEDDRREKARIRAQKFRERNACVTHSNACVTPSNDKQRQNQKQKQKTIQPALFSAADSEDGLSQEEQAIASRLSVNGRHRSVSAAPSRTDSQHHQFIEAWSAAWEQEFNGKYKFKAAADGKAVKELLKLATPEELLRLAQAAWSKQGRDYWNCQNKSQSIVEFAGAINKIRAELKGDTSINPNAIPEGCAP